MATFDQRHLERHRVLPGVTGLWQIEARDNPSFEAYHHLDMFHVENWSCGLDLVILWNTLPTIVARAGRSLLHREELMGAQPDGRDGDDVHAPQVSDAVPAGA